MNVELTKDAIEIIKRIDARSAGGMFFYVASPYSKYEFGHDEAARHAASLTGQIMKNSHLNCFCPIAHSHEICKGTGLPKDDREYWEGIDYAYLESCTQMIVLMMRGWEESVGVQGEIEYMQTCKLRIHYLPIRYIEE